MVERIVGKGPAPDDDTHRREAAAQEMEAMLASLPADQRMHAMIEDDALAGVLARLGLALENNASSPSSQRSEEARVGKECVSTCSSRRSPAHKKKKITQSTHKKTRQH